MERGREGEKRRQKWKEKRGEQKESRVEKVCLGPGFRYLRPVASAPLESQSVLTFSAFSASHSSSKANSSLLCFVHREPSRSPAQGQSACAMAVNARAKAPGTQQTSAIFLLSVLLFAEYHIIHLSSNLVLKHDVRVSVDSHRVQLSLPHPTALQPQEHKEACCSLKHMPAL